MADFDEKNFPRIMLGVALCLTSTVLVAQAVSGAGDMAYLGVLTPLYVAFCIWILYIWWILISAYRGEEFNVWSILTAIALAVGWSLLPLLLLITGLMIGAKLDGFMNTTSWHAVFSLIYLMGLAGAGVGCLGCCGTVLFSAAVLCDGENESETRCLARIAPYLNLFTASWFVCPATFAFLLARNLEAAAAAGLSILDPAARPLLTPWVAVFAPIIFFLAFLFLGWLVACLRRAQGIRRGTTFVDDTHSGGEEIDLPAGCSHTRDRATLRMPPRIVCLPFLLSHAVYMLVGLGTVVVFLALVIAHLNGGAVSLGHLFDPLIAFWCFILLCMCIKPCDRHCAPDEGLMQDFEYNIYARHHPYASSLAERNEIRMRARATPSRLGLTKKQFLALPFRKLKDTSETLERDDLCVICQSEFEAKEKVVTLKCEHTLHKACAKKWLAERALCPLCKQPVQPTDKEVAQAARLRGKKKRKASRRKAKKARRAKRRARREARLRARDDDSSSGDRDEDDAEEEEDVDGEEDGSDVEVDSDDGGASDEGSVAASGDGDVSVRSRDGEVSSGLIDVSTE